MVTVPSLPQQQQQQQQQQLLLVLALVMFLLMHICSLICCLFGCSVHPAAPRSQKSALVLDARDRSHGPSMAAVRSSYL